MSDSTSTNDLLAALDRAIARAREARGEDNARRRPPLHHDASPHPGPLCECVDCLREQSILDDIAETRAAEARGE